jgi:hypothetical protein
MLILRNLFLDICQGTESTILFVTQYQEVQFDHTFNDTYIGKTRHFTREPGGLAIAGMTQSSSFKPNTPPTLNSLDAGPS